MYCSYSILLLLAALQPSASLAEALVNKNSRLFPRDLAPNLDPCLNGSYKANADNWTLHNSNQFTRKWWLCHNGSYDQSLCQPGPTGAQPIGLPSPNDTGLTPNVSWGVDATGNTFVNYSAPVFPVIGGENSTVTGQANGTQVLRNSTNSTGPILPSYQDGLVNQLALAYAPSVDNFYCDIQ